MKPELAIFGFVALASATILWDGRFSDYSTAADFDKWSWSNQVGQYQTYIYGNLHGETASSWLTLGSQFKNPATSAEAQGAKVKLNASFTWNGGPMLRTELIPQTMSSLSGHLYFHVSLQIPTVNAPDPAYEHQIVFWEGHFADIKYGQLSVKGTWYNFILETGSPGGLWVSTGSSLLQKVFTGSLNGNGGTDWHIGALRLPVNGQTQQITETDIYYSGIYVEDSGPTTQP
ncbi:unnamed protein product [Somion occarium]|uniref:Glycoside hydrolase 131 catalytic N-terminal domain-containing protein n=1 Tax=Somion occarium TaxID=3059160 RepID=A0ABP1CK89_9APHY